MSNLILKLPNLIGRWTDRLADEANVYHRFMTGAILLTLGLALVFPPKFLEGPSLLRISRGRGLTVSDLVALVPLAIGANFILQVLWRWRTRLQQYLMGLWGAGAAEIFLAGVVAGIVIDGAFTNLDWKGSGMILWGLVAVTLATVAIIRKGRV